MTYLTETDITTKLKDFESKRSEVKSRVREAYDSIVSFTNKYPISSLNTMTLDQYFFCSAEFGHTSNFCYIVQNGILNSSMKTCRPASYGVYSDGYKFKISPSLLNKGYSTPEAAFRWQLNEIIKLLKAGEVHDLEEIDKNEVNSQVKCKLLSTYFPKQYLPINTNPYIENCLNALNIPYNPKESCIIKLERLLTWKRENKIAASWDNIEFMWFCNSYLLDKNYVSSNKKINNSNSHGEKFVHKTSEEPKSVLISKLSVEKAAEIKYNMGLDNNRHVELEVNVHALNESATIEYEPKPEKPLMAVASKLSKEKYRRDNQRAYNALKRANYCCEFDSNHPSFIRRSDNTQYTEAHHLVPFAFQDQFSNSLDVEANIVSLCSNCHNQIHFGRNPEEILMKLYEERKEQLELAGINVKSIEELLKYYK